MGRDRIAVNRSSATSRRCNIFIICNSGANASAAVRKEKPTNIRCSLYVKWVYCLHALWWTSAKVDIDRVYLVYVVFGFRRTHQEPRVKTLVCDKYETMWSLPYKLEWPNLTFVAWETTQMNEIETWKFNESFILSLSTIASVWLMKLNKCRIRSIQPCYRGIQISFE